MIQRVSYLLGLDSCVSVSGLVGSVVVRMASSLWFRESLVTFTLDFLCDHTTETATNTTTKIPPREPAIQSQTMRGDGNVLPSVYLPIYLWTSTVNKTRTQVESGFFSNIWDQYIQREIVYFRLFRVLRLQSALLTYVLLSPHTSGVNKFKDKIPLMFPQLSQCSVLESSRKRSLSLNSNLSLPCPRNCMFPTHNRQRLPSGLNISILRCM